MEELPFIKWCLENLNQYWVILLLMTIESSFIPFPSEIVIIPAAYLSAATATGAALTAGFPSSDLSIIMIVFIGTLGAVIGALINYALSIWIGRPVVYKFANSKFGHMCLINEKKVKKAEEWFEKKGAVATFFGRLVPAVRQLISIPAGISRMNLGKFITYTALGAAVWNGILASIGYYLSTVIPASDLNDTIKNNKGTLTLIMVGLGVLVVLYLLWQGLKKPKKQA